MECNFELFGYLIIVFYSVIKMSCAIAYMLEKQGHTLTVNNCFESTSPPSIKVTMSTRMNVSSLSEKCISAAAGTVLMTQKC